MNKWFHYTLKSLNFSLLSNTGVSSPAGIEVSESNNSIILEFYSSSDSNITEYQVFSSIAETGSFGLISVIPSDEKSATMSIVDQSYDVSGSAHWNNMCDVGLVVHRDFETHQTRVITRKVREQGLYGSIGEVYFDYNLSTHLYE